MSQNCFLCPRRCGAARPESAEMNLPGVCRSPRNPVVARAGLHFWEEPVISGTNGSGTVFFSGCNLHCVFCQNYGIRVQNSVFECVVDSAKAHELKQKLIRIIDTSKDSLRFYNLGDNYQNRIEHYGTKIALNVEEPLIF